YTGKRKQKKKRGFKTKKEAQAALFEAINDINKGNYLEPSKKLFKEYLIEWLDDKKTKILPSTYTTYKWLVEKYIMNFLGHIELSKINPPVIQRFYNELISQGNLSTENVQKIHSLINDALKRAEKWGIIQRNVAALV
ncbi:N-terminal phage integrase SAM-like domain-containing protein, partial [Escherichia coli]|uniref:N-terminal phage integrase SAM-like domain-containing protein n=1 Tax=Escherichia coli TaxID=562 RepID=UPI0015C5089A